jgi:exopolysaccharide biosynthesis polyprenyl glycosylphosphotransferase
VIVSQSNAETIGHTLASLSSLPVPVKLIFDTGFGTVLSRELPSRSGLAVFHISEPPLTDGARIIKRAEDIIFGGLLLLLFMPLMLAAAIAIKVESRGPVLFRQPRYGHNNRVIEVLKFRTMYHNMEDKHAAQQTERGDPRVTRVGAFLRRHSLDELPQLLNVMSGSMSLIGPRPHALGTTVDGHGLESVVSNYYARHQIKPGITGWAQVSGWRGNLDSVEKAIQRVEHDLYYIENWSLTFDLWIILKTLGVVLWDKEAF